MIRSSSAHGNYGCMLGAGVGSAGVPPAIFVFVRPSKSAGRAPALRSPIYDSTAFAGLLTGIVAIGVTFVLVITTTLVKTKRVPRIVRRPSDSPPRKYPTSTATTEIGRAS